MQPHGDDRQELGETGGGGGLSRREVVGSGSLLLGAFLLAGCNNGSSAGKLPDTYWAQSPTIGASPTYMTKTASPPTCPPQKTPPIADTTLPPGVMARSQWTSKGVARPDDIHAMNGVKRITIHHDGMPPTSLRSTSEVTARLEQIRQAHVYGRGWADIAYHFVIDPEGRVWEARSIRFQGAHVKDQNENNLGILVMGNFDVQQPSPAAISALDRFTAHQMLRYNIPMSQVRTHQEMAKTECPGTSLQRYAVRTRSGGGQMAMLAANGGVGLARG